MTKAITRQEIMSRLSSLPYIEIFEVTEEYVVAYNQYNETDFTIRFAEYFTKKDLKDLIHVSPNIPEELQFDLDMLVDYLWEVMDHNAFLTLNGLWYVCGDEEYRSIAQYHDCADALVLPEHDAMGCMWFVRQVCIVDVARILRHTPKNLPSFRKRELIVVTLHELRHLMMDTNPALPEDVYPLKLGSEFMVERYAQEACDDNQIAHIFIERND
jgi:hypothetical protein